MILYFDMMRYMFFPIMKRNDERVQFSFLRSVPVSPKILREQACEGQDKVDMGLPFSTDL